MNKRWVIIVAEVVLCLVIGTLLVFRSGNGYLAAVGLGLIIGGVGAAIAVAITVLRKRTKQK